MSGISHAVFLSYASQDAAAAVRISSALRQAGVEVWFDQSELRGGDVWDQRIRREIRDCTLFIPVISENTASRHEGYFRLEWDLADQRTHMMARDRAFIVPVCLDTTVEASTDVPESFHRVQWTRLLEGNTPPEFTARIVALLGAPGAAASAGESTRSAAHVAPPPLAPIATAKSTVRRNRVAIALMVTATVILAYVAVDRLWLSKHTPAAKPAAAVLAGPTPATPAIPGRSVAVLPFVDMSERKDQEYFSDGLSEELIDHLAHSPDLKVIARTSSFQFKNKNEDVRTIGQRLGVANLLEGSVRTSDNTVRVTAQLIRASDGIHIWSETYDRQRRDIFKVQDEIAAAVVAALKTAMAKITPSAEERPSDMRAYSAVLRGRFFVNRGWVQDSVRAIAAFEEAIKVEPRYATAWAELSGAYNYRGVAGEVPPTEAYAAARRAADQALAIDPNLPAAHRALAKLEWNYNRNFDAAAKEDRRADELDPNPLRTLQNEGFAVLASGQAEEAASMFSQAVELDPLNSWSRGVLWYALFAAGRLPEADSVAHATLDLNPSARGVHCQLGAGLLAEKKLDAALAAVSAEPDQEIRATCLPDVLWALGRRAEADGLLTQLKTQHATSNAMNLADSYALRNEKDEAFKWLYRAFDNREPFVTLIKTNPLLLNLRGDPRFVALLRKMNLPE